jgi:hypothetical protein
MWERDTAQLYGFWSLIYLGRLSELRRRYLSAFQQARERGNFYLESTLGPYVGTFARLSRGEVALARAETAESIAKWTQRGFHVQHLDHFYACAYADLYEGDGDSAWKRVVEYGPAARASLLTRIQQVRIDVLQISGRSAVSAASRAGDPAPLLREAEGYARKIARERMAWADPLAALIRAGVAAIRRQELASVALLREAARGFDAVEMALFASASRRRLGTILGGEEGRSLIAAADAWMASEGIVDPARMAACMAPGFGEP